MAPGRRDAALPRHFHLSNGKFCPAFQQTIDTAGMKRVPLSARSLNLSAYAERWVAEGNDLQARGLYLDVPPWQAHVFSLTRGL
jgi:hypothetical protein